MKMAYLSCAMIRTPNYKVIQSLCHCIDHSRHMEGNNTNIYFLVRTVEYLFGVRYLL